LQKKEQYLKGLEEQIKDRAAREAKKELDRKDKEIDPTFADLHRSSDQKNQRTGACDECSKDVL
jgi:hypothetical protein